MQCQNVTTSNDYQRENKHKCRVSNMSLKMLRCYLVRIIHRCLQEWLGLYLHRLVVAVDVVFHNVDAIVDTVGAVDAVDTAGTGTIKTDIVSIVVVVHRAVVQIDGNMSMFART